MIFISVKCSKITKSVFDSFIQEKLLSGENIYYSCESAGRRGRRAEITSATRTLGLNCVNVILIHGSNFVLLIKRKPQFFVVVVEIQLIYNLVFNFCCTAK